MYILAQQKRTAKAHADNDDLKKAVNADSTSKIWMIVPLAGLTNTGLLSLTSMTMMIRSAVPHKGGRPWSVATTVRLKRSDD